MLNFSEIEDILKQCDGERFNVKLFNKIKNDKCDEILQKYDITSKYLFYLWKNNITELPRCPVCGNILKKRKRKFCSAKCRANSTEIQEKMKQTNLERYGVEHVTQSPEIYEKVKQTNLERYGYEYSAQSSEIYEKVKQTNLERYGYEYSAQSPEIQEKMKQTNLERYGVECSLHSPEISEIVKQTNLERYGVEHPLQSSEIYERVKQTNLERYGVEYATQSPEIYERVKQTNLERYGVEHPSQSSEIQEKIKQTNLERYGVENPLQSSEIQEKILFEHRKKWYDIFIEQLKNTNYILLSSKEEFITQKVLKYQHFCGNIFETECSNIQHISCPVCALKHGVSEKEKELLEFIKSIYNGTIIENDRTILNGKEMDIYLPDDQLAFEFNGTYWHREGRLNKKYHQEKTLKCKEKGIELVHIFEYEWDTQRYKIENLIKSKLHIFSKRIYARDCIVKEISLQEYSDFLDLYHLQNSINSSIRYGLFYNDELVSVIGFEKSNFEIKLQRYCVHPDYFIEGGFSKLIKHSGIDNFISYIDLSHFSGKEYFKNNFKKISITEPNYKWVKGDIIINNFNTQKHNLSILLENYDPNLTEDDNMLNNGYVKVYDAGNIKVEFSNN